MKNKIWVFIFLFAGLTFNEVQATSISDIDTIGNAVEFLRNDVELLRNLHHELVILRDNNFVIPVANSTQTVTLSNAQKQGLIAQYQALKTQMQTDFNSLP